MNSKRLYQLKFRARILKAMAHPTRLFIIEELAKKERNVSELTAMIGVDVSTISKHLSLLRSEGIITDEKRGTNVYYHLKCPCVLNFYECVEGVIKKKLEENTELQSI